MGSLLSNIDINDILKYLGIPIIGIFAKNNLPKQKIKGLFIINLDDFGNAGTHWTCFSTIDENVVYWDPFGMPAPHAVDKYIKAVSGKTSYFTNKIQVQYLTATYCGWYVISFLHHFINAPYKSVSKRVDSFNDMFNSTNLDDNYSKLLNYVNKLMTPQKMVGGLSLAPEPKKYFYTWRVDTPKILLP